MLPDWLAVYWMHRAFAAEARAASAEEEARAWRGAAERLSEWVAELQRAQHPAPDGEVPRAIIDAFGAAWDRQEGGPR